MIVWLMFLAISIPLYALTLYVIKIGGTFFFIYAWTFLCMNSVVSPSLLDERVLFDKLITLRASCGAVYCNRPCLFVCVRVCVSVMCV